MNRILNKLTNHFEDNRKLACITACLFALGILVFIINNTAMFFVDEKASYFWPRLCMKSVTDICWVVGAVLGTKYYPTKRNNLLMPTLIFYFLGDIAVLFSVPVGGGFMLSDTCSFCWPLLRLHTSAYGRRSYSL